jgi:hypothetical protein
MACTGTPLPKKTPVPFVLILELRLLKRQVQNTIVGPIQIAPVQILQNLLV